VENESVRKRNELGQEVLLHQYQVPSVSQLAEALICVAPRIAQHWEAREPVIGPLGVPVKISHGRARQLWMVVGMWDRALGHGKFPEQAHRTAAQLFTTPVLRTFWELAQAGSLRKLAPEQGQPAELPLATLRITRDCLRILAGLVLPGHTEVWLPSIPQTDPKTPVRSETLGMVYRRLAELAAAGPLERSGTALSYEGGQRHQVSEATYQRIVAAQDAVDPLLDVEWYVLGEGAQTAVRRWLEVRRQLIDSGPLQGGQTGLWVTLVPTKAGPPGVTLRPQGLTQAFARGMSALNWLMAGEHGWEPMPTRMEQLRRAVTAVTVEPVDRAAT
jgi:hypothetical protein